MSFYLALIAAAAPMVGGSAIMLRPEPKRGRHCRRRVLLARPVDALNRVAALCRNEGQVTLHARTSITRQFICTVCHQPSPDPASYEEAAS